MKLIYAAYSNNYNGNKLNKFDFYFPPFKVININ